MDINKILNIRVIEPVKTERAAPIVFLPKKSISLCSCIDSRKLNALPVPEFYHIPVIEECFKMLGHPLIFSNLDATGRYWQVEINDPVRVKTAFTFRHRLFGFLRMLLDWTARLAHSDEQWMLLLMIKWKPGLEHPDDIFIFPRNANDHESQECTVL